MLFRSRWSTEENAPRPCGSRCSRPVRDPKPPAREARTAKRSLTSETPGRSANAGPPPKGPKGSQATDRTALANLGAGQTPDDTAPRDSVDGGRRAPTRERGGSSRRLLGSPVNVQRDAGPVPPSHREMVRRANGSSGADRRQRCRRTADTEDGRSIRLRVARRDLEGERSPGRTGRPLAGNGGKTLRTRRWSKASEPAPAPATPARLAAMRAAHATRDGPSASQTRSGEREGATQPRPTIQRMSGTERRGGNRQGGNGGSDAVRLSARGVLRGVESASRRDRRAQPQRSEACFRPARPERYRVGAASAAVAAVGVKRDGPHGRQRDATSPRPARRIDTSRW